MIIGANPWASKGSILVDPRIREHLTDIVHRGGRVFVVDPRNTETAKAFELPIRAGTDAWFLLSMLHVLVERNLYDGEFDGPLASFLHGQGHPGGEYTYRILLRRCTLAATSKPDMCVHRRSEHARHACAS